MTDTDPTTEKIAQAMASDDAAMDAIARSVVWLRANPERAWALYRRFDALQKAAAEEGLDLEGRYGAMVGGMFWLDPEEFDALLSGADLAPGGEPPPKA